MAKLARGIATDRTESVAEGGRSGAPHPDAPIGVPSRSEAFAAADLSRLQISKEHLERTSSVVHPPSESACDSVSASQTTVTNDDEANAAEVIALHDRAVHVPYVRSVSPPSPTNQPSPRSSPSTRSSSTISRKGTVDDRQPEGGGEVAAVCRTQSSSSLSELAHDPPAAPASAYPMDLRPPGLSSPATSPLHRRSIGLATSPVDLDGSDEFARWDIAREEQQSMPSDPASHPTHSTAWKHNEVGVHEPLTWSSPESDSMSNRDGQRDVNTGDTSGREDRSYSYDGDDSLRKLLTEEEIDAILETTTISDYTPSEMRELSLEGEGVVRAFKAAHQQLDDSRRGVEEPGTTQRRVVIVRRAGEGHTSSGPRSFEVAARHYPDRNSLKAATGIPTTVKSQSRFQSPSSSSMSTTVSRSPMFPSQPIPTLAPPRPPLPPPNHCISIANVALVSQARRQR